MMKQVKRWRGIVWDLDGTLIDSLGSIERSLNGALVELGYAAQEKEEIRTWIGDGLRDLIRQALGAQGVVVTGERVEVMEGVFQRFYRECWRDGSVPYVGIVELLKRLAGAGVEQAILSNKPDAFTREIVGEIFPEIPFVRVFGQREGVARKPEPDGLLEIIGGSELERCDWVMIGDSGVDVETARRAGVDSLGVLWGYARGVDLRELATCYVETAEELAVRLLEISRE